MRKIQAVLAGGASLLVMVGIVYFLAYAAVITCPNVAICTGTNANDTITIISGDDQTVFGRAGDDVILDSGAPGPDESHLIFGGHGNDDIRTLNTCMSGGSWTIFGEYGNDSINISTLTCNADHHVDGGPGNDTLRHSPNDDSEARITFVDGRGRDVIIIGPVKIVGTGEYVVYLVGDNEQDTVRIHSTSSNLGDGPVTISLHRDSGRDVIACPTNAASKWDITIFLNGNYKAVDQLGNNLRQAALLGGNTPGCPTTATQTVTIIP